MKAKETIQGASVCFGAVGKSIAVGRAINRHIKQGLGIPALIRLVIALALLVSLPGRAGELEQFFYSPIDGTNVVDLTTAPEFPEQPFTVTPANWFSTGLEGITNASTYYGSWLRGYLEAPVSGAYRFYLSADDSAELYLSTDHREANKQLIAKVTVAVPENDYREQLGQKSAAITLERGRQYYFEIRHKQGAGDDHVQVGWLRPDDVLERPIPLQHVQRFVPSSYLGPLIRKPANIAPAVESFDLPGLSYPPTENQHVIIAAVVSAVPPVYYQWFRNGVPLDGENLSSLDLGPVSEANDGDVFNLLVATGNGITLSDDLPLNVKKDVTPPTLLRAAVLGMTNGFVLSYSKPVDPATATNVSNYAMNLGIAVTGVSLLYGTNLTTVVVRTTPFPASGIPEVTVNSVRDLAQPPNFIAPDSTQLVISADGQITLRYYGDAFRTTGGIQIPEQPTPSERFPDHPDLVTTRPEMGIPPNVADNYLAQLIGFLVPPVTGDYRFFIASDDSGILYLSTDADPANKRAIAVEPQWNGYRSFTTSDRRTIANIGSTPQIVSSNFPSIDPNKPVNDSLNTVGLIHLDAGQRYYIEGDMVEGGGGDNLDVAWQIPGGPPVVDGQAPIPGEFLERWAAANVGDVAIFYAPTNTVVLEGRRATVSVRAQGTEPFTYQWFRNGKRIVDATEPGYTFPARLSDDGAHYSVRVRNAFSETWSSEAVLTVTPDHEPPHIVRAYPDQHFNKVTLRFDEPVLEASATNLANYSILRTDSGEPLVIDSAKVSGSFDGGYTNVVLRTAPIESGVNYTVRTSGIEDLAALPNSTRPDEPATFTGWVLSRGFVLYERWDASRFYNYFGDFFLPSEAMNSDPGVTSYLTSFESPKNVADYYVGRVSGFFISPGVGRYDFYMSTDQTGALFMASDEGPTSLTQVASEPAWRGEREWTGVGSGGSADGVNNTLHDNLPILNMASGVSRYLELIWTATGGGDHGEATYSGPGEPVPANGTPSRLTGDMIAAWANPDGVSVDISEEPQDTRTDGAPVTLSVSAAATDGDGQPLPLSFQWQLDGVNVLGANGNSYTTPYLNPRVGGYHYRCRITCPGSEMYYTREASVGVSCDDCGQLWLRAKADATGRRVIVTAANTISLETATNLSNYLIEGLDILGLEIADVSVDGPRIVILHTSAQEPGREYALRVTGLLAAHYPLPGANDNWPLPFYAWKLQPGWVLRDTWFNLAGFGISSLTLDPRYPDQPDKTDFLPAVDSPQTDPNVDSFGVRLSGWLEVTNTGDYLFAIAADDQAVFYLSTDESPVNKRAVVAEPEWNAYRDWNSNERRIGSSGNEWFPGLDTEPINRSENTIGPVHLVEGLSYYFETLQREGGGGDHVEVTMYPAGTSTPQNGTPGISGAQVWNYSDPGNLTGLTSPDEVIALAGWNVKFTTMASVSEPPLLYQWELGGVPIANKTNSVLEIPSVALSQNGNQYRCRIMAPGVDTRTAPALLTVLPVPQMVLKTTDSHQLKLSWPSDGTPHLFQTTTNLSPPVNWQTQEMLDQDHYLYQWNYEPASSWSSPQLFFRIIPEVSPP